MALSSLNKQDVLKLDLSDKKIMFFLSQNSRWKRSDLAKKLNISMSNLNYKIERLIANDVIEPVMILNMPHFGLNSYIIFIEKLNDSIDAIDKGFIYSFSQTVGKYNYVLHVITVDINSFLITNPPNSKFTLYELVGYIPDNYNPFSLDIKPYPDKNSVSCKLDKKDFQLLSHLCKDPTDSILGISTKTGLDRGTIKQRMASLLDNNYIEKFRYILNVFRLGFLAYYIKIDLPPAAKEDIIRKIREDKFSGFLFESYNSLIMWYIPPSHRELLAFTSNIENTKYTINIEVVQIAEIINLSFLPKSVLDHFEQLL